MMKPILFNTEMVRAILDGRKTCTRRAVKPQPKRPYIMEKAPNGRFYQCLETGEGMDFEYKPPCHPGDVLYVRETWGENTIPHSENFGGIEYRADYYGGSEPALKWRPSIHMPKEAARIFLRVTDVRVERLQDIDGVGQRAEGAESKHGFGATRGAFMALWNSTIKLEDRDRYSWGANPWVWVIEFERCEKQGGVSP